MSERRNTVRRRGFLGVAIGLLGAAGGCSSRSNTERPATEATTDVSTSATERTSTHTQPTNSTQRATTEATTDTATSVERNTSTPTPALNQTDFAVTQLFGPNDDDHRSRGPSVVGGRVRVQLICNRNDWEPVYQEIEAQTGVSYQGLPFVSETMFGVESLVAVWVEISDSRHARLVDVVREGDGTVRARVTGAGRFIAQVNVGRVLLIRVPNAQRVTRAVAEYTDDEGKTHIGTAEKTSEPETETATNR